MCVWGRGRALNVLREMTTMHPPIDSLTYQRGERAVCGVMA
jgi:hypothetical protein